VHLLIVGGNRAARLERADAAGPARRIDDVEHAFPNRQAGGVKLVLTQSTYVMQTLLDSLNPGGRLVVTADRERLRACAPEAFERRGPWRLFDIRDDGTAETDSSGDDHHETTPFALGVPASFLPDESVRRLIARAYGEPDPRVRLAACREAAAAGPAALTWLALASAARENGDAGAARDALDRTLALAPEWAAAHFEDGKFWLAADDMVRARDGFARAGALMPTFSAAFSNLGATLGELDDPEAALAAFTQALASDPDGFTILNNIGVVTRELGRLAESEAALTRVVALAPAFVFGYYNLGHTRFLAGDYAGAIAAYEAGRARDPGPSPRQAARLAMARLAAGDAERAERELWAAAAAAAEEDERTDILLEAYEIGRALLTAHPVLAVHRPLLDRIADAAGS
jgi:tetratricopeptide (TPR) repeat protein